MAEGTAVAAPAPRFSSVPAHGVAGRSVPAGQELLVEAGFSAQEIRQLVDDSIVGSGSP
jgi:hypothetical protein